MKNAVGSAVVAVLPDEYEVEGRAEAPPANVYRELQAERVAGTRQWVQSPSFHDDLVVGLDAIGSAERRVEN